MTTPEKTFQLVEDGAGIQCLICGRTSHNPTDVEQRYYGYCHRWHELPPGISPMAWLPDPTIAAEEYEALLEGLFERPPTAAKLADVGRWLHSAACAVTGRASAAADREAAEAARLAAKGPLAPAGGAP